MKEDYEYTIEEQRDMVTKMLEDLHLKSEILEGPALLIEDIHLVEDDVRLVCVKCKEKYKSANDSYKAFVHLVDDKEYFKQEFIKDSYCSRHKNGEKTIKNRDLKTKEIKPYSTHGLSLKQRTELLSKKQDSICEICKKEADLLNIDHCHETGKIRGILCRGCNYALGNFKDNIESMKSAIIYLEKNK